MLEVVALPVVLVAVFFVINWRFFSDPLILHYMHINGNGFGNGPYGAHVAPKTHLALSCRFSTFE